MAVRLSALRAGSSLLLRNIFFCFWCSTPGPLAAGRIVSIEQFNDLIGNRTHDLPACNKAPQRVCKHISDGFLFTALEYCCNQRYTLPILLFVSIDIYLHQGMMFIAPYHEYFLQQHCQLTAFNACARSAIISVASKLKFNYEVVNIYCHATSFETFSQPCCICVFIWMRG
jgi:hypothetical protein